MSVQAGIWNFDGKPVNLKLLQSLSESLKHQGPDHEARYVQQSVALIYRPFHTTAESRRETQPCASRRGFILTWDGRLDNRDELIADLGSRLKREPTDVEIVSAAFDSWETQSFRRFVGDWAVSIWKPQVRELVFAVDYMAIRHIFYYLKNDRIWWSTDLTPLVLLSDEQFHVDDNYIAGYLAYDPDGQLTPYSEIREVPPGHFVQVRNGAAMDDRYWRPNPNSRIRYKRDTEYEEHFRHVFRQSVCRRLRADSPILAELSGGIDSSSIVCMADDIIAKQGAPTPRLDTLSFYDKTEPSGDDWIYFPKVEEKRGRVGIHIDAGTLRGSPASLQYPMFAAFPGNLGATREIEAAFADVVRTGGYRVLLSGIGGDEFMGAIPYPCAQLADLVVQLRVFTLIQQLAAWSLVKRKPWIQLLWQTILDLFPPSLGQYFPRQAKVESWIDNRFAKRAKLAKRLFGPNDDFGFWMPSRRSYVGGVLLMANKLAKFQPSSIVLEESRYPYLDQDLIEFVLSIPATQLLRPGERRSLMRRALTAVVPPEILSRRTKQFGARAHLVALQQNLDQLRLISESLLSSSFGYVNQDRFREVVHDSLSGKTVHITRLLRTISLEFWLRDLVLRQKLDTGSPTFRRLEKFRPRGAGYATPQISTTASAVDRTPQERRTKYDLHKTGS